VHRLKTRSQFQAVLAGTTVARTAHFAMHRAALDSPVSGPHLTLNDSAPLKALFVVPGVWLGVMVPKRWAKRAVTRNTIKRQVFEIGAGFESNLPQSAHLIRLRSGFDRSRYKSAMSDALKAAVRLELQQLFEKATAP
jgi:ribonuclease P protein component